jgi:hypothetical protein
MVTLASLDLHTLSRFIPLHAKEDHEHAALIWEQIDRILTEFPTEDAQIEFGFDCLARVYPYLVWDDALCLTRSEICWQ